MKTTLITTTALLALGGIATPALAQEVGRVISSQPLVQQVPVTRQVCGSQPMAVTQQPSGAGAVLGAVAGGLLGNTIGQGAGRALGTAVGVVGGAIVGNNLEAANSTSVQNVTQCGTQTVYENQTVGYNVTYEYAGRQYQTQMPNDPGQTIALQVTPVGAAQPATAPVPPPSAYAPQAGYAPAPTVVMGTSYVPNYYYPSPYYAAPYYAPFGVTLGFGYRGGHYRH